MNMKVFHIMILFVSLLSPEAIAQKKVGNGSFNALLKVMLKHDVNEVIVLAAATKKNVIFLDAREKKEYVVSHITITDF